MLGKYCANRGLIVQPEILHRRQSLSARKTSNTGRLSRVAEANRLLVTLVTSQVPLIGNEPETPSARVRVVDSRLRVGFAFAKAIG